MGLNNMTKVEKFNYDKENHIQESKFDDIRNCVNPYSNKLFFHISFDDSLDGKILKPRIPNWIKETFGNNIDKAEEDMKDKGYVEDIRTPRVCFSNSINGCLNAILNINKMLHIAGKEIYVYIPEKPIKEYKHKTNKELIKEKLIFDAKITNEMWILEDVKLKLYGTIVVDSIYDKRHKRVLDPYKNKSDKKVGECDFNWHWQANPKILQEAALFNTETFKGANTNISPKQKIIKENHVMLDRFGKPISFFQEASQSRKPKERRNKQRNLKQNGYDPETQTIEIENNDGTTERIKINIGEKSDKYVAQPKPTYVTPNTVIKPEFEYKNIDVTNRTINLPPKKVLPIIDHEIGHIRRLKTLGIEGNNFGTQNYHIGYFGNDKDASDLESINNFIKRHKSILKNINHGLDPEEYLADLYSARKNGYKQMIKVLRSCITKPNKFNLGNKLKRDERRDRVNMAQVDFINRCDEKLSIIQYKLSSLYQLKDMTDVDNDISKLESLKNDITKLKSIPTNKMIDLNKIENELNEFEKNNNIEFSLRIKFLQEMKKFDEGRNNTDILTESFNPLSCAEIELRLACVKNDISYDQQTFDDITRDISIDMIMEQLEYEYISNIDAEMIDGSIKIYDDYDNAESIFEYYKTAKEGHVMLDRFGKPISFFQESKDDDDEKDDVKKVNDDNVGEIATEGDFDEYKISDDELKNKKHYPSEDHFDDDIDYDELSKFGSDTNAKSPNNEYDNEEIKILNSLIADEQQAMGGYFDGTKNSKDPNLQRLYADIGAEERYHSEQLLYAKSQITGEEYEPQDPKIKKEYQELLEMGMDEDTAISTVIDRQSMSPNYDDKDDTDIDEIQEDVEMLEYSIDSYINNLKALEIIMEADNNFTMEQRESSITSFMESCIIQEAIDNIQQRGYDSNSIGNPITLLLNGFVAICKFISRIVSKFKKFINTNKVKQARIKQFIKENGIIGIFKQGVSLYFYDAKTPGKLSIAPFQYLELMNNVAVDILSEHQLTTGLTKIDLGLSQYSIKYGNASQGLKILEGVILTKTKVIVDDNNKNAIENLFFGYNPNEKINVNRPDLYETDMRSNNIYNRLNNLLNWTDLSSKKIEKSIQAVQNLQQDMNSIYYTNRNLYNSCVDKLILVQKCFNKFLKAMVSDINTIMKLNNGILESTNSKDTNDINKMNNVNNMNNINTDVAPTKPVNMQNKKRKI